MSTWHRCLVLTAATIAACGLKTAPVAPELVQPRPATDLRATSVASGVRLVWRRPTRYSGGGRMRDLERFAIERSDGDAAPFTSAGVLVLRDRYQLRQPARLEWIDTTAVPGMQYRYRVVAVTLDGTASPPSDPARIRHRVVADDPDADDPDPS